MKKQFLFLLLIFFQVSAFSITIMKNVGHGDCYVIISDGRVIVVDAGSAATNNGLISLLRSGYFNYDRIVITHIHSDHFGGLISAGKYLKTTGSKLTTNMLVSNHGVHDLDLVINESNLSDLITTLRGKPIVVMDDNALSKLAFSDENIAIEGLILNAQRKNQNENPSSLILKVTEIRDGEKKATLFLGDIEKSQQAKLFSLPNSQEFFKDVCAVTIPHHGRPGTIHRKFFNNVKEFIGPNTIMLHSDKNPLDSKLKQDAIKSNLIIESTTYVGTDKDVILNYYKNEQTYCIIENTQTDLKSIVQKEFSSILKLNDYTIDEVVSAVAKYSNFDVGEGDIKDRPISLPSPTYINKNIEKQRADFQKETEDLLTKIKSSDDNISKKAENSLKERIEKMTKTQIDQFNKTIEELAVQRQTKFDKEIDSNISQLLSVMKAETETANAFLKTNYSKLNQSQIAKYNLSLKEAFNLDIDRKIERLKGLDPDESRTTENELKLIRNDLNQTQRNEIDEITKELKIRHQIEDYFTKENHNLKIICNKNLDDTKYFVYEGYKNEWTHGTLKYVIKNNGYSSRWDIFYPGSHSGSDLAKYGKQITSIRQPSSLYVDRRDGCEYCGEESIGWCHMRNKYVCESHHDFYQNGTLWRCP